MRIEIQQRLLQNNCSQIFVLAGNHFLFIFRLSFNGAVFPAHFFSDPNLLESAVCSNDCGPYLICKYTQWRGNPKQVPHKFRRGPIFVRKERKGQIVSVVENLKVLDFFVFRRLINSIDQLRVFFDPSQ